MIIISGEYLHLADRIKTVSNDDIVLSQKNPYLPKPVAYHPEMQFLDFGETVFVLPGSEYLEPLFKSTGRKVVYTAKPSDRYPHDVLCNAKIAGHGFFCNTKTIDRAVLQYATASGLDIINVKQGYTGCSILKLNNNAILTSDRTIATKASENGYRALFVNTDGITLAGYNCGFIGGSGGIVDNRLVLTGKADPEIRAFAERESLGITELTGERLFDVGGVIQCGMRSAEFRII
ncbi:MAG: hypothetical protein Q4C42_01310 [Clostridia bacterium]|nr:hypothetical protein [Clostridia bacterium]